MNATGIEAVSVGGLRGTIDSQRHDIEYLRCIIASLRRELATYRPDPDQTPAPRYDGHVWSSKFGWCGPYHLVPFTWEPYPVSNTDGHHALPDIWVPAKKALCGEPFHGARQLWPAATDVCHRCVCRVSSVRIS